MERQPVASATAAHLQTLLSLPVAEDLLIRADRAAVMGSLARGMAHDLRGPLQTLTLLVDPQTDLLVSAEGGRLRGAVSDAVQHLAETIGRFSQVYGPPEGEASPIIVDDLLNYVSDLQRYQRGVPAVEIELRLPGGLPAVRGIEQDLRHILLGLLLNAKEAMVERGDSRITVAASLFEGDVRIVVEDNGPGLSERAQAVAFEPFFTTRPGHQGIGLTVARWLAQRHGGSLTLESAPSGGTRALLTLPSCRR